MSASRRTDIPAFYSEWFIRRLKEGSVFVRNPFRPHHLSSVALNPDTVDAIVFWTKNAEPMTPYLDTIDKMGYPYYFEYTITPYGNEVERYVPDTLSAIRQFQKLSGRLGKHRVIWRYDPVLLNGRFTVEWHSRAFTRMCGMLGGYAETCIFSFADRYAKTDRNAKVLEIGNVPEPQAVRLAESFSQIAGSQGIALKTCCEAYDFSGMGIGRASCIDKDLIERILGCPLTVKADKNQRQGCNCVESFDIGAYDTCLHGCVYCYAVSSYSRAQKNAEKHEAHSPVLIGEPCEEDTVTLRKVKAYKNTNSTIIRANT